MKLFKYKEDDSFSLHNTNSRRVILGACLSELGLEAK